MKLIDTNVFIYATGREHEYRDASVHVLRMAVRESGEFVIDIEVLQEVLHFYRSRQEVEAGIAICRDMLVDFPNPLAVGARTMRAALDVMQTNPTLQSRDAVHAAVVIENELDGIISADQGFDQIANFQRFDPKEF